MERSFVSLYRWTLPVSCSIEEVSAGLFLSNSALESFLGLALLYVGALLIVSIDNY